MTAWVTGMLAGASVLLATEATRRWPWRIADLVPLDDEQPVDEPLDPLDDRSSPAPTTPSMRHRRSDPPGQVAASPRRRSSVDRSVSDSLERDIPAAIDLLVLSVSAGHSLHTAVVSVARTGTGPVAGALRHAVLGFERGGRLGDELAMLPTRHGAALQTLTATLTATLASGAPVAPALQRLADAERRRRRRRTEERVRRLPVVLLAPLVGLVLPAFVIVTIVPVALTTARSATFASASVMPASASAPAISVAASSSHSFPLLSS